MKKVEWKYGKNEIDAAEVYRIHIIRVFVLSFVET